MVEQAKKIVSIEILHLDELGYGPEGKHTRREWRAECLENLLAGKAQFEAWQQGWLPLAENAPAQDNNIVVHFEDAKTAWRFSPRFLLDFSGHNFSDNVDVTACSFLINTSFDYATFEEEASFYRATFEGDTSFGGATFERETRFDRATFERDAWFDRATFERGAWFKRATFGINVSFTETHFKSTSQFIKAVFEGGVDFENAQFDNVGHFEAATFNAPHSRIPKFRGCKISDTRLEFSDDTHFTQADFTEDDIQNISFLKRLADEHGQKDQALNFNALELRAKRKLAWSRLYTAEPYEGFWFCAFTFLYEKISDFGRSFTKPLFYLLGLLILSYIVGVGSAYLHRPVDFNQSLFTELNTEYLLTKNDGTQTLPLTAFRAATEYSLYRSGDFLDFTDADKNTASINMRLFGSEIEPWWARLFGFLKGIVTAVLLFLAALGLRNTYRVS